jgi:alpha-L-fucosidase
MVYLHLLDWRGDSVTLPGLPRKVVRARTLTGGKAAVRQTGDALEVAVPPAGRDPIDTIVELKLDGPADGIRPIPTGGALTVGKVARASNVYGGMAEFSAEKAVDDDEGTRWATDGGTHSAWLEVDLGRPTAIGRVRILQQAEFAERIRRFELQIRDGEAWRTILTGTTTPAEYVRDFPSVTAQIVRLNILEATEGPTIDEFQLFGPGKR